MSIGTTGGRGLASARQQAPGVGARVPSRSGAAAAVSGNAIVTVPVAFAKMVDARMCAEIAPVDVLQAATPRLSSAGAGARARRWVAPLLGAALAMLAAPTAAYEAPATRAGRAERTEAWVIGSSSVHQAFGRLISRELSKLGYRVERKAFTSAGLARPDYRDMQRIVETLPIGEKTAAVVVYLGINDAQALWLRPRERTRSDREFLPWRHRRWSAVYRERARQLIERICQRGALRALMVLPVDVKRPRLQRRLRRIRALQEQAAQQTSCGVALPTAGDEARLVASKRTQIRRRDGFHMTAKGAQLVWDRIGGAARRALQPRAGSNAIHGRRGELEAVVNRILNGRAVE